MNFFKRINWLNTLFILITLAVGVAGTALLCVYGLVRWPTWILAGSYLFISGVSVTAGYHRLFSHKTYKATWPIRLILLLLSTSAFEGSALEWCTDHRNHHLYTDTDKDPYSIKRGFWWAHIGWLFMLQPEKRDFSNVEDLNADPLVRFQHRFFPWLGVIMGFGVPAAIAALWGDALGGLIVAGALRIAVNHQLTFCINSVCHLWGKRNYSDRQSGVDNWMTALFTYGEGFHNFHHQFPRDYRNGVRAFHFDPTKWTIYGLSKLRLVSDLNRISSDRIIRYRLQMEEKNTSFSEQINNMIAPVREKINSLLNRIEGLEKEYRRLRASKASFSRRRNYRKLLKSARQELNSYLNIWSHLIRQQRRMDLAVEM